ncbi:hypothetical protein ABTC28_19365, partial [Acinetobacter baumannii]
MNNLVDLAPMIGVGCLVKLRTCPQAGDYAVVQVGRRWPRRGTFRLRQHRTNGNVEDFWVFAAVGELVRQLLP